MKKFNEKKFISELMQQHWEYIYYCAEDPNAMWEIWKSVFLEVLDKHAPLQPKKHRSKKVPWITSSIKELINKSYKLERKAVFTNLEQDWLNYKTNRNKVNTKLRNAKRNYYSTQIAGHKRDPKRAWKSINNLLGRQNKPTVVNELNLNDNNLTTPKDITEGFNDYFSNIGPKLASEIEIESSNIKFEMYTINAKSEFTAFKPVVVSHVYRLLLGLSSNKATGIDKISCKIIELAAQSSLIC